MMIPPHHNEVSESLREIALAAIIMIRLLTEFIRPIAVEYPHLFSRIPER
jgi:hypothetical protein